MCLGHYRIDVTWSQRLGFESSFINLQTYMAKPLNINFTNKKLNLDYLAFKLPNFREQMLEIATIFHKYGLNCRIYNDDTEKYSIILYDQTLSEGTKGAFVGVACCGGYSD